ncbi:hypothetical protein BgiMline_017976 [Biomphalaria glabrata]|nr:hypothetical protein BgiMline_005600 [Biomphalaria glabrata]
MDKLVMNAYHAVLIFFFALQILHRFRMKTKQVELTIIIARKARLRILSISNSISGIRFFCQQSLLPQDDITDVFLRMVKLVFDYVINVTADVLLSGHYVKLERLQYRENWFKTI